MHFDFDFDFVFDFDFDFDFDYVEMVCHVERMIRYLQYED